MLTLTEKPKQLDTYSVVNFDLDLCMGEVGSISINLRSREAVQLTDFQLFKSLNEILGEEIHCEYEGWSFTGCIQEIAYDTPTNTLNITLMDALSKLAGRYGSQVFSELKLGKIVSSIIPSRQDFEISSDFDNLDVKMAIQYQESDLDFLKKLVNLHGGQIWCAGGTIFIGTVSTSGAKQLKLGSDILAFNIKAGLGPEKIQVMPIPYKKESSSRTTVESSGSKFGDIQESYRGRRKKQQADISFHMFLEDTTYNDPESYGRRFLRSHAGGRLSVAGMLKNLLPLGSYVKFADEEGNEESLVIRELRAISGFETTRQFYFEASAPEAVILDRPGSDAGLKVSTAIVVDADDPERLNRVRVIFPWDPNESRTPWLRVASPYWGEEHMYYIPPEIDDAVLVTWGQEDIDPIVLGSLSIGHVSADSKETLVFKTVDGQTITVGKKEIKIANEAEGGGGSSIELKPDKIIINSDNIELSSQKDIKLDSKQMNLSSKKAEVESDELKLKSKQGTFESKLLELKTPKLDVKP